MNNPSKITRLVGFTIIILTIATAAVGFFIVRNDIEEMRDSGRENILWSAAQIEIELLRLRHSLAHFVAGDPDTTPQVVNNRFDILWSRISLFQQGTVGARLRAYDERDSTVAALFILMKSVETDMVGLKAGDTETAARLERSFELFADDLRRLSRAVLHGEERVSASQRENLSQSSGLLTIISAAAVLTSLLMIVFFARETNQFRSLALLNARLLHASNRAGKAKSQFLAMMSHELRTPMNGVLGLLALVKQQGLSAQQGRLLDQAERSGHQMISLLGDILDFSDLQDDRLKLENKPFEPAKLGQAVYDMFHPVAVREGIVFEVNTDASCPNQVLGDFSRMRQALTHLATYLLETAGTQNIALDLSHTDGRLTASLSFDYSQLGGEWEPELIMGNPDRTSDGFASEALGPAVSRGLIERMGGATKLSNPTDDRIAVVVSVPASELVVDTLLVRMVCQSTTLEAICRAAFRGENVQFLGGEATQNPHVIMIEGGGEHEPVLVHKHAELYPEAFLVALGRPANPDLFDDTVEVPIDVASVRQAKFMRLANGASLAGTKKLRYAGKDNTT